MTTRLGIAAAMALGLAACNAAGGGGGGAAALKQEQARTVSVVTIEMRPISGGIVTSGVLAPRNQVAVSPDLSGYRVSRLLVEEGSWVRAGQPLAEMDGSILKAQLAQQDAALAQQKVAADQRAREAARVADLDNQGVIAEEQIQSRRFAASSAKAGVAAQTALAHEVQVRLDHMVLRAPVSGLVLQRNVNLGDISGAGSSPWFVMADGGQIELYADMAEADFDKIRPGMHAIVTLADASTADGVVRLVSPRVDATSRLGKVRITLPVRPDIRAGGYAKASFTDISRATPALPETAVRYDASGASVMVVDATGKVSQFQVRTGDRGGGYVELLSGPPAGSRVVAKAASQILPGDYVKVEQSPKAAGP
ncbi:MAG TPA: efflux RND transporter periplasmic adaptor subunit [Caulobacteraceae bacterium]|jgi:HlyD family secretion protein|nr:efflux RND transporter periplasmic adaptor subunit [Caulobacteraceae bacterium]